MNAYIILNHSESIEDGREVEIVGIAMDRLIALSMAREIVDERLEESREQSESIESDCAARKELNLPQDKLEEGCPDGLERICVGDCEECEAYGNYVRYHEAIPIGGDDPEYHAALSAYRKQDEPAQYPTGIPLGNDAPVRLWSGSGRVVDQWLSDDGEVLNIVEIPVEEGARAGLEEKTKQ